MGRPTKLTAQAMKAITHHRELGQTGKDIAEAYGVHPSTITKAFQRILRKQAGMKVTEGALTGITKLNQAIRDADPIDDKEFILKATTALLDRDGHSPQSATLQINNVTNTQINIPPLFAASEAEDVRRLLGGEVVDVESEQADESKPD